MVRRVVWLGNPGYVLGRGERGGREREGEDGEGEAELTTPQNFQLHFPQSFKRDD